MNSIVPKNEQMKKIYVITAVFGYWDMSHVRTIFATDFEYKAKFYCSKANALMEKYKPYFESLQKEIMNTHSNHPRWSDYYEIGERLDFVSGRFHYEAIEIRFGKEKDDPKFNEAYLNNVIRNYQGGN